MLPQAARLTSSEDFRRVVRVGRRAGRSRLVVHAVCPDRATAGCPRIGFVVSKGVGNSVTRHRVTRRLRHLLAERLGTLPMNSALVVRALPPAAHASSAQLASDVDACLRRLELIPTGHGDAV